MEKVGELLEVYDLNLTEVFLAEEACVLERVHLRRRTIPRWAGIFSTVGKFTQTRAWTSRPHVVFFGHEPDVQMAVYLAGIILDAVATEQKRFRRTSAYRTSTRKRLLTNSFTEGLIARLNMRLAHLAPKGKGLVPARIHRVDDELHRQHPELNLRKRQLRKVRVHTDAYSAGQAAGDRVNLNRPLTGTMKEILSWQT